MLPSHGANPHYVYEALQMTPPQTIYDFSENVNVFGPPPQIIKKFPQYVDLVKRYPDPLGEPFLSAIAHHHNVPRQQVVLGNGASEIFSLLARRYANKNVLLIEPTFAEYAATLQANHVTITQLIVTDVLTWELPITAIQEQLPHMAAIYLCIPNNPTGAYPAREQIQAVITMAAQHGCEVVIDEAFLDWYDDTKTYIHQFNHVIVVRSMTKMYAIPGIRLGYAIAHDNVINALKQQAPHWHVNAIALAIGTACLQETQYVEQARQYARLHVQQLQKALTTYGCKVTNSVTNYVCFKPPDAKALFHFALREGIVLRHTENFVGLNGEWLRIGIKDEQSMAKLYAMLDRWFQK